MIRISIRGGGIVGGFYGCKVAIGIVLEDGCSPYRVCYTLEFAIVVIEGCGFPCGVSNDLEFPSAVVCIRVGISISVCY